MAEAHDSSYPRISGADITPTPLLEAWEPNTQGIPCPWREGDCFGHGEDHHRTRWCYCRRNAILFPRAGYPTDLEILTWDMYGNDLKDTPLWRKILWKLGWRR